MKGTAKKEPWLSLGLQNQKNVLTLFYNKVVLLSLTKLTGETGVGEMEEEEGKPWHRSLENDSLGVENTSVISLRRD